MSSVNATTNVDVCIHDINRLHTTQSAANNEKLKFYAQRYFKEIGKLLGDVPSELLLLLKTNDCLRHIDKELGCPANTAAGWSAICFVGIFCGTMTVSKLC